MTLDKWTLPSNYAGKSWHGWLVAPVSHHRDSDILTESNWKVFTDHLDKLVGSSETLSGDWTDPVSGEESGPYEIVRERCSLVGWVGWIAIHPDAVKIVKYAESVASDLASYPVLDEDAFSRAEYEAAYAQFEYEAEDMRAALVESLPHLERTIGSLTVDQLWDLYLVVDLPEPYTSDNGGTYVHVDLAAEAISEVNIRRLFEAVI